MDQNMDRYIGQKPELASAYVTAGRLREIGQLQIDAVSSGRLTGACRLTRLFLTDIRYRRVGTRNFVLQLLGILLVSKSKRRRDLGYPT